MPSRIVVAVTPEKGDISTPGDKLGSTGTAKSDSNPGFGQAPPPGDGGYDVGGEGDSSPEKSPVWQVRKALLRRALLPTPSPFLTP